MMMWPFSPTLVVGGTYSGQIVVWDMRTGSNSNSNNISGNGITNNGQQPVLRSPISAVGHTHPVYSLGCIGSIKQIMLLQYQQGMENLQFGH